MLAVFFLLIEVLLMGALSGSSGDAGDAMALVMIFLFSLAFILYLSQERSIRKFSNPILLGYLWRLFLVLFDIYGKSIYNLPNSGYDSEMYYRCAVMYSETGYAGQGEMFSTVMGTIMRYAGINRLFSQFMVMLFSVAAICVFAKMLVFFPDVSYQAKKKMVTIVSILPNYAILSSIFLRESVITMLITMSLFFFVKWVRRKNIIYMAFAFVVGMSAALFHGGSAAICIGYMLVLVVYDVRTGSVKTKPKNLILAGMIGLVVTYLYINYQSQFFGKIGNITDLSQIGNTNAEGGSSYAAYVGNSNSIASMVIFTIPRIVYFLFSPFPWQWRNLGDIIAFVFSSLFYLSAIKNAISALKHKKCDKALTTVFLILALCTAFVFAWGVTNTGTATRHRDKMIMIYAMLNIVTKQRYRQSIDQLTPIQ